MMLVRGIHNAHRDVCSSNTSDLRSFGWIVLLALPDAVAQWAQFAPERPISLLVQSISSTRAYFCPRSTVVPRSGYRALSYPAERVASQQRCDGGPSAVRRRGVCYFRHEATTNAGGWHSFLHEFGASRQNGHVVKLRRIPYESRAKKIIHRASD